MSANFDAILEKLTAAPGGPDTGSESASIEKLIKLEEMRQAAQDRRDAREREERREERAEAARSDQMKLILGLASSLLPSLLSKGTDPALLAVITGIINKNASGEESKTLLQMNQQQTAAILDMQLKGMTTIMQAKDEMYKKTLDDVINREDGEGGNNAGGVAGIMKEVRLGLTAVGGMLGGARAPEPPQPLALNPPASVNPGQPAQPAQQQRAHPVTIVMRQLQAIQEGKVNKPLVARAAMVTVALQDEGLIEALLADDEDEIYAYCLPHVRGDAGLVQWLQAPGVAEWLKKYLEEQLIPQVDMAVNGLEDDGENSAGDAPVETAQQTQHAHEPQG